MMRERRHHQQRRVSPDSPHRHQRQASDFALNGENGHHTEPACCIGCHGCGGGNGSDRKKSPLRRAANVFRLRLRQVASAGRRQGAVGLATYLIACVLLVWLGLNIPALLNKDADGVADKGVRTEVRAKGEGAGSRVLAATTASSVVDATAAVGSGPDTSGDGIGPRLAYGIMVYQRKGYTPEMTLHQFTRMFEALYDPENT